MHRCKTPHRKPQLFMFMFWVLPNQESTTRPSAHETKAFYVVVYSDQPDIKLTIPSEL